MKKARVLIVEDESVVARDIQGMLKGLGHIPAGIVSTGKDAIHAASEKKPDLILMDIVLKGGIDGISAASTIRESQDIPIVYLTAHTDSSTLERAKKTNPHGYLLKPFEQEGLHSAIELALYQHGEEAKLRASKEWFSSILDLFGNAVITCDAKGLIRFMNPLAETLTGWTQGEALGMPYQRILRPFRADSGKPLSIPLKKITVKGQWEAPVRCWLPDKSGTESLVDIHVIFIKDKKTVASPIVFVLRRSSRNHEEEKRFAFAAIRDPLTGLPNRILFEDRLDLDIARSSRKQQKAAVLLFSLTGLKERKGRAGRDQDDRLLQKAAAVISSAVRASDSIARFGWTEFIVLLSDVSSRKNALEVAQRIKADLETEGSSNGQTDRLKLILGLALYPDDAETPRNLIEKAEAALWHARIKAPLDDGRPKRVRPTKRIKEKD